MYSTIFDRKWLYGGPWDLWVRRVDMIAKFIREQKIKPVAMDDWPAHPGLSAGQGAAGARAIIRPRPFPGGLRSPHLHFKGDIYLVNQQQWGLFSGAIIKQYQEKLAKAGTVGFDQLMDVAEGMETLGP